MLLRPLFVPLAFLTLAVAQTPNGFMPTTQTPLLAVFPANITVSPPGVLLQKSDTQVPPTLTAPQGIPAAETYIAFMIDLDVPRNGSTVTLLHWFEPDLTLSPSLVLTQMSPNSTRGASYIGPAPPPGNPHRYTLLLFSQPGGFAVPNSFSGVNPPANTSARVGFNLAEFIAAAALDAPLAGTYFRVLNASGTTSGTGSPAQSSPVQYEGKSLTLRSSPSHCLALIVVVTILTAQLWEMGR